MSKLGYLAAAVLSGYRSTPSLARGPSTCGPVHRDPYADIAHANDPLRPSPAVLEALDDHHDAKAALERYHGRDDEFGNFPEPSPLKRPITYPDTPLPEVVQRAKVLAERARVTAREFADASWALDAALSALRKDEVGYRVNTAANPGGGRNYTPGQLEAAVRQAAIILSRVARTPQPFNVA